MVNTDSMEDMTENKAPRYRQQQKMKQKMKQENIVIQSEYSGTYKQGDSKMQPDSITGMDWPFLYSEKAVPKQAWLVLLYSILRV